MTCVTQCHSMSHTAQCVPNVTHGSVCQQCHTWLSVSLNVTHGSMCHPVSHMAQCVSPNVTHSSMCRPMSHVAQCVTSVTHGAVSPNVTHGSVSHSMSHMAQCVDSVAHGSVCHPMSHMAQCVTSVTDGSVSLYHAPKTHHDLFSQQMLTILSLPVCILNTNYYMSLCR